MSRVFRFWLPLVVLLSLGLQSVSPLTAGFRESEAVSQMEESDPSETGSDSSKDVVEDDDDTKNLHRNSFSLMNIRLHVSEARLNGLFAQHRPDSSVPPPRG